MEISKKLIGSVLGSQYVVTQLRCTDTELFYDNYDSNNINLHEFAHSKCKQKALSLGYAMRSWEMEHGCICEIKKLGSPQFLWQEVVLPENTEIEVLVSSLEWIIVNTGRINKVHDNKFPIKLKPSSEKRFLEVMKSMPNLQMEVCVFRSGVPTLSVKCWNEGGVTLYTYRHSGLIGLDSLETKLDKIRREAKNGSDINSN